MSGPRSGPGDEQVVAIIERAMAFHAAGDQTRAVDTLLTVCASSSSACAAACSLANVAARFASASLPEGEPLRAQVIDLPGGNPTAADRDEVGLAATFIAGVGNDDFAGVTLAWMQSPMATQVGALVHLLGIATALACDAAESGQ